MANFKSRHQKLTHAENAIRQLENGMAIATDKNQHQAKTIEELSKEVKGNTNSHNTLKSEFKLAKWLYTTVALCVTILAASFGIDKIRDITSSITAYVDKAFMNKIGQSTMERLRLANERADEFDNAVTPFLERGFKVAIDKTLKGNGPAKVIDSNVLPGIYVVSYWLDADRSKSRTDLLLVSTASPGSTTIVSWQGVEPRIVTPTYSLTFNGSSYDLNLQLATNPESGVEPSYKLSSLRLGVQ